MSSAQKYRITLEMLRMAKRRIQKRPNNPCLMQFERLVNAMDANDYNAQGLGKYLKEVDECMERNARFFKKNSRASTLHMLTKHLDRQKFKTK